MEIPVDIRKFIWAEQKNVVRALKVIARSPGADFNAILRDNVSSEANYLLLSQVHNYPYAAFVDEVFNHIPEVKPRIYKTSKQHRKRAFFYNLSVGFQNRIHTGLFEFCQAFISNFWRIIFVRALNLTKLHDLY